jgi:hypothetical protein
MRDEREKNAFEAFNRRNSERIEQEKREHEQVLRARIEAAQRWKEESICDARDGLRTVTESALIKRINRRLATDYKKLRKARGAMMQYGPHYVEDTYRNTVLMGNVNVETLARELSVLHAAEKVAQ